MRSIALPAAVVLILAAAHLACPGAALAAKQSVARAEKAEQGDTAEKAETGAQTGWDGSYCPRPLHRATRLIIVTVPSMSDTKAQLHTFERANPASAWTKRSGPQTCVVGARGIGWGHPYASFRHDEEPMKEEGDERTPAGIYRIGEMFGFAKDNRPNYIELTAGKQFCVEDPRSPDYGKIVAQSSVSEKTRGQRMASVEQFRRGIFIDYPARRAAKAGSCIFVQVWRGEGQGTSAHIGLPEEEVLRLQDWGAGRFMAIAIVQQEALARFRHCLPRLDGKPQTGPMVMPLPDPRRRAGAD